MYLNPQMNELREELEKRGIEFEVDDAEELIEDEDFITHAERTGFHTRDGRWISVLYAWTRDCDGVKRGASQGYPAYLEAKIDDHEPCILDVDEILGEY